MARARESEGRRRRLEYVRFLSEPPAERFLFGDVRMAGVWLLVRLFAGWQWIAAGWEKVHDPAWVGAHAGAALSGFAHGALGKAAGAHPDVQAWYAAFLRDVVLPHAGTFAHVVAFGELLVGIALVLGVFTGVAAFFGAFMNVNYLLAGTVSTNPILLVAEILLVLAWRVAGWWGLDRWILPALGTPWRPGLVFRRDAPPLERKRDELRRHSA